VLTDIGGALSDVVALAENAGTGAVATASTARAIVSFSRDGRRE
jgi:hypothetical protein